MENSEHYATQAQADAAVFGYIEVYCNRQQRDVAIGNLFFAEFRRRFFRQNAT
jgi:putative transposase